MFFSWRRTGFPSTPCRGTAPSVDWRLPSSHPQHWRQNIIHILQAPSSSAAAPRRAVPYACLTVAMHLCQLATTDWCPLCCASPAPSSNRSGHASHTKHSCAVAGGMKGQRRDSHDQVDESLESKMQYNHLKTSASFPSLQGTQQSSALFFSPSYKKKPLSSPCW